MKRLLIAALLAALGSPARAEEAKEPQVTVQASSFVDEQGFTTQNTCSVAQENITTKLYLGTQPKSQSLGVEVKGSSFKINTGYKRQDGRDQARALGTLYFGNSFVGGKFQRLSEDNRWSLFAGTDLSDKLKLQATAGDGGVRGAVFSHFGDSWFVGGLGVNSHGNLDANVHYSDPKNFAFVKFGDRPVDVKFVRGAIPSDIALYAASVTNSGNNELDDKFNDIFLPFDIGRESAVKHDLFASNTRFLGAERGSTAFEVRLNEGDRTYANLGYRIGDLGPLRRVSVSVGAYARFKDRFSIDSHGPQARAAIGIGLGNCLDICVARAIGKEQPQTSLFVSWHQEF